MASASTVAELLIGCASAAGTIGLAIFGGMTWRQGRSLITAATDEAAASNALVAETLRDRELRWQPAPSVRWPDHVAGSAGLHVPIQLTNAGEGPALSCRLVIKLDREKPDGWLSPAVDVPAGATVTIFADQVLDTAVSYPLCTWQGEDGVGHNVESVGAIFAEDVLGARYRFLIVRDGSERVIIERRERWRPGTDADPTWAGYRIIWPDYGVRRGENAAAPLSASEFAAMDEPLSLD